MANHLGDLAKDHPQLAVATGTRWLASADGNTLWVIRHGLRALIKTGHAGALALMGFGAPEQIDVRGPHLRANAVAIGGRLDFSAEIVNSGTESTRLMIDYVIHYRKARGGTSRRSSSLRRARWHRARPQSCAALARSPLRLRVCSTRERTRSSFKSTGKGSARPHLW